MFGDGSIDFQGLPRVRNGITRIRKSSQNQMRYIEISDDSSPIAVKDVKPPRTSKHKAEPIEIQSDAENTSGSEATEESPHHGGDAPQKRKASSQVQRSKHAPQKRMKHAESSRRAKERRDQKGKAVAKPEDITDSSDEELLSGRILDGS